MTDAIRRMLGLNSWFPVAVSGSQMSLIEDIKNDILDHRLPLASIMRKAKVLAANWEAPISRNGSRRN